MSEGVAVRPPLWVRVGAAVVRRLPAGRYRAMNALCRRPPGPFLGTLGAEVGGARFVCDVRDGTAREAWFTGKYEPQETAVVLGVLRPGGVFIDVGANWGYFTLVAAARVGPAGKVVSVEPDPRLFELLGANVAANAFSHVRAVRAAAGAAAGELTLTGFDPAGGNWGLSRVGADAGPGFTFTVRSLALDDELDALGIDRVDLLKMDIEGAEGLALKGMAAGLRSGRYERLLVEVHPTLLPALGSSAEAVIGELLAAGYRAWEGKHDRDTTRRAAYARRPDPAGVLREWTAGGALGGWPHFLFARTTPFPDGAR